MAERKETASSRDAIGINLNWRLFFFSSFYHETLDNISLLYQLKSLTLAKKMNKLMDADFIIFGSIPT